MLRALLLLSTLGLACVAEEEGPRTTEGSSCTGQCAIDQAIAACTDFAASLCNYLYRCYTDTELGPLEAQLGFTDETTCGWSLASMDCTDSEVGQAIRDGRQRLDAGAAASCLSTLDSFACMPMADFFAHPAVEAVCENVPVGTRQPGESCLESDDCAGLTGYCNAGLCEERGEADYEIECATAGVCPGDRCVTFVPNQQGLTGACSRACSSDSECGYQAVCADFAAGSSCVSSCLTDADCDGGLVCRITAGHVVGACSVEPL